MHDCRLQFSDTVTIGENSWAVVLEIVIVRITVCFIYTMFLHHCMNLIQLFFRRCWCANGCSFWRYVVIVIVVTWSRFYFIFDFRQTFAIVRQTFEWFAIPFFFQFFPRAGQFWQWLADQAYLQLGHNFGLKIVVVDINLFQELWMLLIEVFGIWSATV